MYRPDLKPYPLPVKPRTSTKCKLTGNTPYTEPESKKPQLSRKRKQSLDSGEPPYTSKLEAKKPKQSPSGSKYKQNKASKPRQINPPPPLPAFVSPGDDLISIEVLHGHSQMRIIDRLSNPNSERELCCREIAPHTRLCVGANGNCLFLQALVAYLCLHPDYIRMEQPAVDREVPRDYVQRYVFWRQRVDSFLEERTNDERYGRWGINLDIYLLADMLNVNVLIFTTFHGQRKWVQYGPALGLERVGQYA